MRKCISAWLPHLQLCSTIHTQSALQWHAATLKNCNNHFLLSQTQQPSYCFRNTITAFIFLSVTLSFCTPRPPVPICSWDSRWLGCPHGPDWGLHPLPCVLPLRSRHPEKRPQRGGNVCFLRHQGRLLWDPVSRAVPVWNHAERQDRQKCRLHGENWG